MKISVLQTSNLLKLIPEENNELIYIHKDIMIKIGKGHATTYLGFINTMLTSNFHIWNDSVSTDYCSVFC